MARARAFSYLNTLHRHLDRLVFTFPIIVTISAPFRTISLGHQFAAVTRTKKVIGPPTSVGSTFGFRPYFRSYTHRSYILRALQLYRYVRNQRRFRAPVRLRTRRNAPSPPVRLEQRGTRPRARRNRRAFPEPHARLRCPELLRQLAYETSRERVSRLFGVVAVGRSTKPARNPDDGFGLCACTGVVSSTSGVVFGKRTSNFRQRSFDDKSRRVRYYSRTINVYFISSPPIPRFPFDKWRELFAENFLSPSIRTNFPELIGLDCRKMYIRLFLSL